jgi:hypothetical protein
MKFLKQLFCKHKNYTVMTTGYVATETCTTTFKHEGCICNDCGKVFVRYV